jgi:integrase/recombinase XerD
MFEYQIKSPQVRQEIERAGLKPVLETLVSQLHSQGYADATVAFYDQAAVHFAFWMAKRHLHPLQVNEADVANFLSHHLAKCRCPFGGVRQGRTVGAGVRHFRAALRDGQPAASIRGRKPDALDFEIQRFDEYLRTASGLQEATRIYRRRYVREFLHEFFRDGAVATSRLMPKNVIPFSTASRRM